MTTVPCDKWVEGAPRDRVEDVACRALKARLAAVQHYLPLAAEKAEEGVEYVHQLRVWARRATAALRLYEELLPRRRLCWVRKQLKRVRRAANDARDCDVLLERLKKQSGHGPARWRETVRAERAEAQEAVAAVHERLGRDRRFARRVEMLLQRVRGREAKAGGPTTPFGDWAREHLRPVVERFFRAVPADRTDEAALHPFRIRGKELRYAVELLAGALPERVRTELYPAVEAMQDRLGEINDLATAKDRLRHKVEVARGSEAAPWRRLLANEQRQLDRARQDFWEWCASHLLQDLRAGFEAVLASPGQPLPSRNGRPPALGVDPPATPLPVTAPVPAGRRDGPVRPPDGPITKARIVGEMGEQELLFPALVNAALAANDRAKYLMTLLQAAREHGDHPDGPAARLGQERLACGITDAALDAVVERTRKEGPDVYHIPRASSIHEALIGEVRQMLAPLLVSPSPASSDGYPPGAAYEKRLHALLTQAPALGDDRTPGPYIDRLTRGQRDAGDSLHLLVMDVHKELNRLQERLATETIDGALAYGVGEADRPLVAAFMAGVNRTRALKFEHPGLGTTATRSGGRLVLQNDIGLTDAHVLVVHVEGRRVTLTYTDVHIDRLVFFQQLFDRFAVQWGDTVSRRAAGLEEDLYHLCLGTYEARDEADLRAYLTFLGSRLVFLIDWNRARKRLRKFAPRRAVLEVLRWAADHDHGHRGFLALGGEQLLFDALQAAGRLPLPPGGQLSDLLGRERTAEFLKFTLQAASEGLRAGRSEFLIRDEISAELRHYIDTVHQGLLEVAAEHASLAVELAAAARDLLLAGPAPDSDLLQRAVLRAGKWEHRADGLVNRCRAAADGGDDSRPIFELLAADDDVADALEEAIYRTSLLAPNAPPPGAGGRSGPLRDLPGLVLQGAQEYLKAVEGARTLHRGSPREVVADFLEAVDRIVTLEHQTDEAHRRAQAAVLGYPGDFRQWHLTAGIADKFEEAADALKRSALLLRDYILGKVLRR
jgi:CHAD domain-containing protein